LYVTQTITIATKHTRKYQELRRVTQDLKFWLKQVYIYSITL